MLVVKEVITDLSYETRNTEIELTRYLKQLLDLSHWVGNGSGVLCPKINNLSFSQSNVGSYAGNGESPKCWRRNIYRAKENQHKDIQQCNKKQNEKDKVRPPWQGTYYTQTLEKMHELAKI